MNTLTNILAAITLVGIPMAVALGLWMMIIAELIGHVT